MAAQDRDDRKLVESHLRAERAIDRIAELRPRLLLEPHANGQVQFLQSRHKIRVAIPGNGWGKTTTMAMALDMALQKEDPYNPDMVPKWPITAIWVCQKFQQMDILRRQLEEDVWSRPWTWNQTRHFYQWPNEAQLHIVSADSDWKHIQGIPVDYVAFDEHPDRKLWNEFMFRRRGKRKTRYMVAATMTLGMTWFVREVIQQWEGWHKSRGIPGTEARHLQSHPSIWVWDRGGIVDNPAMSDEDVAHYESIGHASDKELAVRLKGGYADFLGDSVFDQEALDRQLSAIKPAVTGSLQLVDINDVKLLLPDGSSAGKLLKERVGGRKGSQYVEWEPGGEIEGGTIQVWEEPKIDHTYIMGADFAAGLVGRDYDCCVVLKKREDGACEQVAEARGWWGDMNFAAVMHMLGIWYFNAFLCGERQFGLPAMRRLYDEWGYCYIYRNRLESTRTRRPSDLLGHHRGAGDTIIPNLRAAIARDNLVLRSEDLLTELRQYQYRARFATVDPGEAKSDQLVTGAPTGMHDDMVMALAYAWHAAREVGRFTMPDPDYAPGTYGSLIGTRKIMRGDKDLDPWDKQMRVRKH